MNRISESISLSNFNRPVIVASHPRSGTHLTLDLLRRQFSGCKVEKQLFSFRDTPYINLDEMVSYHTAITGNEILRYNKAAIPLVKTHRLPSFMEPFQFLSPVSERRAELARYLEQNSDKIYVYRDVKSTMVSLYYFTPESERGADIHAFIRQVRGKRQLSRIGFWAYHVSHWLDLEDVQAFSYDSIIKDTGNCLNKIGQILHEPPLMIAPLLPERPKSSTTRRIQTFFSRNPVSTAIMSFESRRYFADSFTCADDEYMQDQIETVSPGLVNRLSRYAKP